MKTKTLRSLTFTGLFPYSTIVLILTILLLTGCVSTDVEYQKLQRTHHKIFSNYTYVSDLEQYGVEDKWVKMNEHLPMEGDCEDFALTVQAALKRVGIESRLVFLKRSDGQLHMITEFKGWALDSNYDRIMRLSELNYKVLKVTAYGGRDKWFEDKI